MPQLFKGIFDIIIDRFSISNNIIVNTIIIGIIGVIAFKGAFAIVKELGFRGNLGSLFHWIIRLLIFIVLYFAVWILIEAYSLWISVPIIVRTIIIPLSIVLIVLVRSKYYKISLKF